MIWTLNLGYACVQYLKEGLSRIDEGWAAARFDSLPHVVHILTSKDRDGEIQFLKEQSDLIEDVVDEVVHAYHHGFNKAIQNYSQVRTSCRRTACTFFFQWLADYSSWPFVERSWCCILCSSLCGVVPDPAAVQ